MDDLFIAEGDEQKIQTPCPGPKHPKGTVKWSIYKKQRNLCTKLLRSAELAYSKDKFSNAKPAKNCGKQLNYFKAPTTPLQLGPSKIHRNYFKQKIP